MLDRIAANESAENDAIRRNLALIAFHLKPRGSQQFRQTGDTPMKQAQIKPGVRALLILGHRGAVAVTVLSLRWYRPATWLVRDASGNQYNAIARQLRPLPPPTGKQETQ